METYAGNRVDAIQPNEDILDYHNSSLVRWSSTMREAIKSRGGDLVSLRFLKTWLSDHEAFDRADSSDLWFPCAPYFPSKHNHRDRTFAEEYLLVWA
jgi:hypothetical protein